MPTLEPLDNSLRFWLKSLSEQDINDTKGLLESISIVVAICAARADDGPRPCLTSESRTKARAWRRSLWKALDDLDNGV